MPVIPFDEPIATEGDLTIRRLLDRDDEYELLVRWRGMPHVHEWWDPDEPPPDLAAVRAHYGPTTDPTHPTTGCMIELAGRPVGYVQFYRWADWITDPTDPEQIAVPLADDPWGLDIHLGEPDVLDAGVGSRTVGLLCRVLHERLGARAVMLTTELTNGRARRAYEKVGFVAIDRILDTDTRDGERVWCWLMRWDPSTR
jgi:aminoglycoside 6'-N-acetyltransferase